MKRIDLGDLSVAYEDHGQGMPLFCIHGYPLNRLIWQAQWENLAGLARVIAPDLRSHGETHAPPPPVTGGVHTMELLASDCDRLLDALEIRQPAVICGLSMGGYIAFAWQRLNPQRFAGLILTATRARPDSPEAKENRLKAVELIRSGGVAAVAESMVPRMLSPATLSSKPDVVQRLRQIILSSSPDGLIADLLGMRDRPDSTPFLPQIRLPVLIIAGKDDPFIPLAEAEEMQQALPDARLVVISDAGHLPNMEQPQAFNVAVGDFLRQF